MFCTANLPITEVRINRFYCTDNIQIAHVQLNTVVLYTVKVYIGDPYLLIIGVMGKSIADLFTLVILNGEQIHWSCNHPCFIEFISLLTLNSRLRH